jgi:MoaA/NifB/PqqE/SkfB family radical SAM enzyme
VLLATIDLVFPANGSEGSILQFDFDKIDEYQIEITSYCNAACPQCPRNNLGTGINPYMPLVHLSRAIINQAFDIELCQRLRQVFFCGSYGDPIMHPDFLEILRDFRRKSPTLWLYIHSNGGVHDAEYWAEIASIMNGYGQIDFGIDGLEDTLHLYRKNVKYNNVITNAQAFINAGGRAQWNFIVFRHNQHQVEQVQQLGRDMGFYNVLIRRTGRFLNHATMTELDSWPVTNENYVLEPPNQEQYRNRSMQYLPELKQQYRNIKEYFDTTPIQCDALTGKKVAVNAEGTVLPCNFFNHNLYDARFRDSSMPGANPLSMVNGKNQVGEFLERYGIDNLNIHHRSLQEIFANDFWSDLVASFNNHNRLFECAMTCGKKFTKVWDQSK